MRAMLLGALALTACGGPPMRGSGAGGAFEAGPLPEAGRFFTPGLADYAATTALPSDPLEVTLRQQLQRSVDPPASLDCLAREYAGRFGADGKDPSPGAIQSMADRCGHWTRPKHSFSVTAKSAEGLAKAVARVPLEAVPGALGVGVARHPDGRVTATLLVPAGEIKMEPVPRRPTGPVTIAGRLQRGDGALEVWVDDGAVREVDVKADPTGRFTVIVPAPGPEQAVKVEIVRRTERFRRTLGLLTLGVKRQDGYAPRAEGGTPPDAAALIGAINAARKEQGLAPLSPAPHLNARLDDWLGQVARGTGPKEPPGIADDRGWPYARLRYAFTAGIDAFQAIDLLLDTPTGRHLLFDPTLDGVAVGHRGFTRGVGFDAVILGVRRFTGRPAGEIRAQVHAALVAARGAPLAQAAVLEAIAQRVADDALAGRMEWKDAVPTVMAAVKANPPIKGGFGAGAFTIVDPAKLDVSAMPHALDPNAKHVGIGVAAGPLPGGGVPRYIIVYLAAEALRGDG